eukprot:2425516-Rhodomonas_salina.2
MSGGTASSMSGTEIGLCYAMSGTEIGYAATRSMSDLSTAVDALNMELLVSAKSKTFRRALRTLCTRDAGEPI